MSYTLELLRMETERHPCDLWRRDLKAAAAAGSAQPGGAAINCAAQAAAAAGLDEHQTPPSPPPTPPAAAAAARQEHTCAKVLTPHSYYDCCINVHVSSLLEHWLGWDRHPEDEHPPSSNNSNGNNSSNNNNNSTAKSLSLSPPPPLTSSRCPSADELAEWISRIFYNTHGCDDETCMDWLVCLYKGEVSVSGRQLVELTRLVLRLLGETGVVAAGDAGRILVETQHLLSNGLYAEATEIARLILDGCDDAKEIAANSCDSDGRTLLSYSVSHADRSADLTRLLLNHGARVWPTEEVSEGGGVAASSGSDVICKLARERRKSAFAWYLRAAMERHFESTDDCETVRLLGLAMGEEPARMRRHVARTMMQLGRGAAVNGPLFLRLKLALLHHWATPPTLRIQCARSVRRSLGPKRLNDGGVTRLGLPAKLQRFLRLEDKGFC